MNIAKLSFLYAHMFIRYNEGWIFIEIESFSGFSGLISAETFENVSQHLAT